jgi:hypothetical protein
MYSSAFPNVLAVNEDGVKAPTYLANVPDCTVLPSPIKYLEEKLDVEPFSDNSICVAVSLALKDITTLMSV